MNYWLDLFTVTTWHESRTAPCLVLLLVLGASGCDDSPQLSDAGRGAIVGNVTLGDVDDPSGHGGTFVSVHGTADAALTDPSGNYRLENVLEGQYTVELQRPGYVPKFVTDVTVEAGGTAAARNLGPLVPLPATVVGIVELADGRASGGATAWVAQRGALAGPDGGFRVPDLPAGRHDLVVAMPGYASQELEVELIRGEVLDVGAFTLQTATGSVEGTVEIWDDPNPVAAGFEIQLAGTDCGTTTLAGGSWSMTDVPVGTWSAVLVRSADHPDVVGAAVTVRAGETVQAWPLTLRW